jgi:hypothetical protein
VVPGWSLHGGCCRRPAAASWFPYIDFPPRRVLDRDGTEPRSVFPPVVRVGVCVGGGRRGRARTFVRRACAGVRARDRARNDPGEGGKWVRTWMEGPEGPRGRARAKKRCRTSEKGVARGGCEGGRVCGEGGATFCTSTLAWMAAWRKMGTIIRHQGAHPFRSSLLHSMCDIP